MHKISIVGCGWLGLPLSESLQKSYEVKCFSRETTKDDSAFWQTDTLIIAINTKDNYLNTLQKISTLTKTSANIILMSSTSVYREFDKAIDEDVLITQIGKQKEAEELIQSLREKVLVLRLGGLMGDDRISGKWKSVSTFSDGPVNYIHKEDVIGIVHYLIDRGVNEGIYNLVAPEHPLRSVVHKKNAKQFSLELGTFEGLTQRVVENKKLKGYKFLHPNPLDFWNN